MASMARSSGWMDSGHLIAVLAIGVNDAQMTVGLNEAWRYQLSSGVDDRVLRPRDDLFSTFAIFFPFSTATSYFFLIDACHGDQGSVFNYQHGCPPLFLRFSPLFFRFPSSRSSLKKSFIIRGALLSQHSGLYLCLVVEAVLMEHVQDRT